MGYQKGNYNAQKQCLQEKLSIETKEKEILNKQIILTNQISESNNILVNSLNNLKDALYEADFKNAQLLDDNNRISQQFVWLYNASTRNKMPNASSESANASNSSADSGIAPSRILQIMQINNINHQKCIGQVGMWQDWYKLNSKLYDKK